MSDSAYQIRSDLLHLAKALLTEEYQAALTVACERSRINETSQHLNDLPAFPTADQIVDKAKRMNQFISHGA